MFASWEKDVAQSRVAAGADLQQAVQVATVMEYAPAVYCDLLKVVALANRESHQNLACVCARVDTGTEILRRMVPDTSAPRDVGQEKGRKEKGLEVQ